MPWPRTHGCFGDKAIALLAETHETPPCLFSIQTRAVVSLQVPVDTGREHQATNRPPECSCQRQAFASFPTCTHVSLEIKLRFQLAVSCLSMKRPLLPRLCFFKDQE